MDELTPSHRRFVALLSELATGDGSRESPLPGVRLLRSTRPFPRSPVVYDPSIVIIGQGRKIGHLGGQVYTYDPGNYLVLTVPLPFECETQASPEAPLLGLSVPVESAVLGELLLTLDETAPGASPEPRCPARGIASTPLTPELLDAAVRLLTAMRSPADCSILGPQAVREIVFRVLQGEQGGPLRALAARNGSFGQIAKVLKKLHADCAAELSVETMARDAGMSVSAFHHNFKTVTSASPLNYLKTLRLHKARMLMVQDGLTASTAAGQVGYASPSQFSREFKRFFGATPAEEAHKLREMMG